MLHIIIIVIMDVAGFSEAIVLCARASIATLPDYYVESATQGPD